jgi:hypothetical protein
MTDRIIFVDIDHTLAYSAWRDGMQDDWDVYHSLSEHDNPVIAMINLISSLRFAGWYIIGVTGRPEKWRQMTLLWCIRYNVMIDLLMMRADDDFRPTAEFKTEAVLDCLRGRRLQVVVFDDRDDVVAAIRANVPGIVVCQVYVGGEHGQEESKENQNSAQDGTKQDYANGSAGN